MPEAFLSRRDLLKRLSALGFLAGVARFVPSCTARPVPYRAAARPGADAVLRGELIDLTISELPMSIDGETSRAVAVNGTVPGPIIRLREGQEVTLRVTNHLHEPSSIHWHGMLVPPGMDGVPGVSFAGIMPGETFVYRFPVRQSGTYWFHGHSGTQELLGLYAPLLIEPSAPEPFEYERDYVVMLSDWSAESPEDRIGHLKKSAGYYNFQKRTLGEFAADVGRSGLLPTVEDFLRWDEMRMDPTDFADLTGYSSIYLLNGHPPRDNWTGVYRDGQRVRLRFINAASMTFFDVRIPGLEMTVVQADGQNVQPFVIDEFRFGPAETYDVIVRPDGGKAYTVFAETMDRSGHARGTLAPRVGMSGEIPPRRPRPTRTMEDMGMPMHMGHGSGMDMTGMSTNQRDGDANSPHAMQHGDAMDASAAPAHGQPMAGMAQPSSHQGATGLVPGTMSMNPMQHRGHSMDTNGAVGELPRSSPIPGTTPVKHGPEDHGPGNQSLADYSWARLDEPGRGLENNGRRVLVYTDLRSLVPNTDRRPPGREIELHLTGQMDRYMWSFDGKKYSEAPEPIHLRYGERVRLTFVNDTMMEHPLHLHGMWMYLENGNGAYLPRKHTVIVKPAERLSVAVIADAPGHWAFHCHLLLHMEAGMFRVVHVSDPA